MISRITPKPTRWCAPYATHPSHAQLQRVLKELESQTGLVDADAAPEPPQQATTRLGDVWNLNQHRILCASSTVASNLMTVLEHRSADLIYADLPYNVDYSGSPHGRARRSILNDNLGSDFGMFLYDMCVSMLVVSSGAIYISMSSSELHTLYKAFTDAGGHWSTYLIQPTAKAISSRDSAAATSIRETRNAILRTNGRRSASVRVGPALSRVTGGKNDRSFE